MSVFSQPKLGGKPLASLSSTLLARKGQAKPAMRPQGFGGFGNMSGAHDDLGWNDMGSEPTHAEPTPTAAPPVAVAVPPVLVQREALREEFGPPEPTAPDVLTEQPALPLKPVSVATATRIGRETSKQHGKNHPRSAFTLRLDQDRHLRLRLAVALHNASAQTLVTEALDQLLRSLPEVDDLVRQLPARAGR